MTDSPTRITRSILAAGVLGGVLGGVAAFAASRMIVPATPGKTETAVAASEARAVVESFISKLDDDKGEALADEVKSGRWLINEQEYASFRGQFTIDRARFRKQYGERGEVEFVREEPLSPSLARLIYLERYQHDGILWIFVVYRTMGGWRLVGVSWKEKLAVAVDVLN
jgi:hypothetical protein